jgi:hypothetical protein
LFLNATLGCLFLNATLHATPRHLHATPPTRHATQKKLPCDDENKQMDHKNVACWKA